MKTLQNVNKEYKFSDESVISNDNKMIVMQKTQRAWATENLIKQGNGALKKNKSPLKISKGKKLDIDKDILIGLKKHGKLDLYEIKVEWSGKKPKIIKQVDAPKDLSPEQKNNYQKLSLNQACGSGFMQIIGMEDQNNEKVKVYCDKLTTDIEIGKLTTDPENIIPKKSTKNIKTIEAGMGLVVTRSKDSLILDKLKNELDKCEEKLKEKKESYKNNKKPWRKDEIEKLKKACKEKSTEIDKIIKNTIEDDLKKKYGIKGLNHHFGYVLMKSGDDYITMETHTYKPTWDFIMYDKTRDFHEEHKLSYGKERETMLIEKSK